MIAIDKARSAITSVERALPFAGPVPALGAMLVIAATTTVAAMMMG